MSGPQPLEAQKAQSSFPTPDPPTQGAATPGPPVECNRDSASGLYNPAVMPTPKGPMILTQEGPIELLLLVGVSVPERGLLAISCRPGSDLRTSWALGIL